MFRQCLQICEAQLELLDRAYQMDQMVPTIKEEPAEPLPISPQQRIDLLDQLTRKLSAQKEDKYLEDIESGNEDEDKDVRKELDKMDEEPPDNV
jgi:hypothetical protein